MATRRNKREDNKDDILVIEQPDMEVIENLDEKINEELESTVEVVKPITKTTKKVSKKVQSLQDFLF